MELNKGELIELGFVKQSDKSITFQLNDDTYLRFAGFRVSIQGDDLWIDTNAKTIQDIKDLIRLFK